MDDPLAGLGALHRLLSGLLWHVHARIALPKCNLIVRTPLGPAAYDGLARRQPAISPAGGAIWGSLDGVGPAHNCRWAGPLLICGQAAPASRRIRAGGQVRQRSANGETIADSGAKRKAP